jgi:hypothetical protein|uniref:Uncharacterized protein n=1 Tax=Zea mays TaxID=4577 RepID=A0A804N7N4_MAIZE
MAPWRELGHGGMELLRLKGRGVEHHGGHEEELRRGRRDLGVPAGMELGQGNCSLRHGERRARGHAHGEQEARAPWIRAGGACSKGLASAQAGRWRRHEQGEKPSLLPWSQEEEREWRLNFFEGWECKIAQVQGKGTPIYRRWLGLGFP